MDSKLTRIAIAALILGAALCAYPPVSNYVNQRAATAAIKTYDEAVATMSTEALATARQAAQAYNEALAALGSEAALTDPERLSAYEDTLDVTGTGIMGYIQIDKLGVNLPIYHGTSTSVLQQAAGHLEGTSLPIGGSSTHAVISAHRGLPTATLFTHLDQLEEGDTFTITVLGEVLTYQVDQILVVLPTNTEPLYIEEDADYVTLLTCTPYGINTHRLLVRGVRVDEASTNVLVSAEAHVVDPLLVAASMALPVCLALLVWLLVRTRKKAHGA